MKKLIVALFIVMFVFPSIVCSETRHLTLNWKFPDEALATYTYNVYVGRTIEELRHNTENKIRYKEGVTLRTTCIDVSDAGPGIHTIVTAMNSEGEESTIDWSQGAPEFNTGGRFFHLIGNIYQISNDKTVDYDEAIVDGYDIQYFINYWNTLAYKPNAIQYNSFPCGDERNVDSETPPRVHWADFNHNKMIDIGDFNYLLSRYNNPSLRKLQ